MLMVVDITQDYSTETKELMRGLRKSIINHLSQQNDHKKILSFLGKCCVINISEESKTVHIGIPNEFVLSQVKKFFGKPLQDCIHTIYQGTYSTSLLVFPALQKGSHDLQIDCKKILQVENKQKKDHETMEKRFNKEFSDYFGILFESQFTFDRLVTGSHNELVASAAQAVAESPGQAYNPLFIYGGVGLGKTHIMQAIGNHIIQTQPEKVVIYLPTSKLIDEIVKGIRKNKLGQLMSKLDQVDVLLIDDIQFLAQKEKTQEIFHNIFNDFHMKKKQIVITCDRPPKTLNDIAERLKSRFSLGIVADIQTPDLETRIAILASKADQKEIHLPIEFLEIIAKHITTNVRELEGALNLIITKAKLTNKELSEQDIHSCLQTLGYKTLEPTPSSIDIQDQQQIAYTKTLNFGDIVEKVATYYHITSDEIKGESRKKEISLARQLLMLIAKKQYNRTLERIGNYFGGKNHATVIYSIKNIQNKIKIDQYISRDYQHIMDSQ